MSNINLIQNKGFIWYANKTVFVKGCFFDSENNFYEKSLMPDFFSDIKNENDFISRIKKINGIFTILVNTGNLIMTACDTSRIFPLFYTFEKNEVLLSDDILFLKERKNLKKLNEKAKIEFKTAAHTLGNKTLVKNIFQTQSNEYLIFKNGQLFKNGFFFSYSSDKQNPAPYETLKTQAISVFDNAFKRLIVSLNNRPVVLPLSGGFDSRLIAVMLKKYNYQNVTCFTFGKKNNFEVNNSKKTADALHYKWIFIEYTDDLFQNYIDTEIFKEYVHYAGKYSSMPFLQEYFAVKYLKENKLISGNSVFIPGHSGDLLGGSQLVKVVSKNIKHTKISDLILKKKFFYNSISRTEKNRIKKTVESNLRSFDSEYEKKAAYTVFEDCDIKEKLAKVIFNSTSVFNFFGYEQRFPFWDKELLMFFKTVPFEDKKMKKLYDDILKNYYFKMYKVNFEKEIQPSQFLIYFQKIKNYIKPVLPYFLRKKQLIKNDWKNYKEITDRMLAFAEKNQLPINKKINKYNEIIIQWYLLYVNELIK